MGCLNSQGQFEHWFGNLHFSGVCNRACYFCIGQHMMGLDPVNNLDTWPLNNIGEFVRHCKEKGVKEINLTGSDTDPLLYLHLDKLCAYLREQIPDVILGIRTNGVLALRRIEDWKLFDKGSISITSFDPELYKKTMGCGSPPDLKSILAVDCKLSRNLKINIVLCPEILGAAHNCDLLKTLTTLHGLGIRRVNLREPYGQPHIGDPLAQLGYEKTGERLGMPFYNLLGMDITYWDVHYVEVESINLYANGVVSLTYPVTQGYHPNLGKVQDQGHFLKAGRQQEQWIETPKIRLPLFK